MLPRVLSEGFDRWADIEIDGESEGVSGGGSVGGLANGSIGGSVGVSEGVSGGDWGPPLQLKQTDEIITNDGSIKDGIPGDKIIADGVEASITDPVLVFDGEKMSGQRGNTSSSSSGGSPTRLSVISSRGNIATGASRGSPVLSRSKGTVSDRGGIYEWQEEGGSPNRTSTPSRGNKGDNTVGGEGQRGEGSGGDRTGGEGSGFSKGDILSGGATGGSSSLMVGIFSLRSWLRPTSGQGKGLAPGLGLDLGLGLGQEKETFTLQPQVIVSSLIVSTPSATRPHAQGQGLGPGLGQGLGSEQGFAAGPRLDGSMSGWGEGGGGASVDDGETNEINDDHSIHTLAGTTFSPTHPLD